MLLTALVVGSVAAPATVSLFSANAQIWDGYYLLVSDGKTGGDPVERAFAGSLTGAAPVRFTVFDGLEEYPADSLSRRLDAMDPRFDPFMRAVAGYFVATEPDGAERSLSYLRTGLPPAGLLLRLTLRSPAAALTVLDFDVRRRLLAAGMVVAIALAELGVRVVAGRLAPALGMAGMFVPWAVAALNAGGVAVIAAAAVIPALRRLPGPVPARAATGAAAVIVVVTTASLLLGGALTGFAVGAAVMGSVAATAMLRFTRTRAPAEPRGRRVGAAVLAGSLVAVAAVVAVAGVSLPSVGVPAPDARGAALTWDELAWLGVWDGNRGTMPTAADYVTHIAFQEGLPYGRAYRLPEEGERLPLSSFRFDAGARRLIRDERVVVIYDQSWLERVIAEARGVGRLLVDAGAVTVQRRLLADVAPSRRPPGSVIALALVSAGIAVGTGLWAAPARTQRR
jgi:hypothetical protein